MAHEKPEPLSDERFAAAVYDVYKASAEFNGGEITDDRIRNLNYYYARPFGDEKRGRSQVVSSDAQDTVEGLLPYLIKTFMGSPEVVKFLPEEGSDTKAAEQATDYCNYIFYRQNPGFLILYEWIKDALMLKNGVVKWYWKKSLKLQKSRLEGLSIEELTAGIMSFDDDAEIVAANSYPDPYHQQMVQQGLMQPAPPGQEPMLYDVEIHQRYDDGKICIEVIPPEHFVVNRRHNSVSLDNCMVCGHREPVTKSDLLEMGFDYDEVCALPMGESSGMVEEQIDLARDQQASTGDESDYGAGENNPIYMLDEIYVQIDKDGDGIVEMYKVHMVGTKMLAYEEIDEIPIASMTPIIMPHRYDGRAAIDLVVDIQHQKSTMMRQIFDSAYQAINPRMKVLNGLANLGDLMEVRPGGLVRVDDVNAVTPLQVDFIGREGFAVIEYLDSTKEMRTGQSRYNQGMDANSLNKTAMGINRIMDASMARSELMARVMAETGLARLMKGILHLTIKHNNKKQMVQLRDEYIEINPDEWRDLKNMTINVGLGTGNVQEELQNLNGLATLQKEAANLGMVKPIHFWNTAKRITEKLGYKDVESYFVKPLEDAEMPKPPNPAEIEAKKHVEIEKIKTAAATQENIKKAEIEAESTRYRIDKQAAVDLKNSQIKADSEVEKAVKIEAIRVAGQMMMAGFKKDLKTLTEELDQKAAALVRPTGNSNGSED